MLDIALPSRGFEHLVSLSKECSTPRRSLRRDLRGCQLLSSTVTWFPKHVSLHCRKHASHSPLVPIPFLLRLPIPCSFGALPLPSSSLHLRPVPCIDPPVTRDGKQHAPPSGYRIRRPTTHLPPPHNPNGTRGVTSVRDEKELRDVILTKDAEIKSLKMENAELRRNVTLGDARETYTTHTSIAEEMGWCPCWYRQPGVGLPVSAGGRF